MATDELHDAQETHEPKGARTPGKAALASWIGSALEYYDFFIYGTAAALVFNRICFPAASLPPVRCSRWQPLASDM